MLIDDCLPWTCGHTAMASSEMPSFWKSNASEMQIQWASQPITLSLLIGVQGWKP